MALHSVPSEARSCAGRSAAAPIPGHRALWAVHADGVRRHGQGAVGVPVDQQRRTLPGRTGQTGEVQHRQEVIGRRHGPTKVSMTVEAGPHSMARRPSLPWRPQSNRSAQSKRRQGLPKSMPPRLCTTLPLLTSSTPRLRNGARARTEVQVIVEGFGGVDRELHDRDVGLRKRVRQHRPGAVIDAPAVVVRPTQAWRSPHRTSSANAADPAPGTRSRTALAEIRRSRGSFAAPASRSPPSEPMYQCAETTRIARGRGTDSPNAGHASVSGRLPCVHRTPVADEHRRHGLGVVMAPSHLRTR